MGLNGLAAFGVELLGWDKLGRARGVGNDLGILGVPDGVDADRVGDDMFRVVRSVAVIPAYLLARVPAVTVVSSVFFLTGAGMALGAP